MPRFQFSMWWLMVILTAACMILFLAVTFGRFFGNVFEVALASVLWCVLPTPLLMFAIYARGDAQAFAIGALIPWVALIVLRFPGSFSVFAVSIWLLPMCTVCGVIAGVTRRWIKANLRD